MKKIILLASIATLILTSCHNSLSQRQKLVVKDVESYNEKQKQEPYGLYGYKFENTDFVLFTDSVYAIGDTLKITK